MTDNDIREILMKRKKEEREKKKKKRVRERKKRNKNFFNQSFILARKAKKKPRYPKPSL